MKVENRKQALNVINDHFGMDIDMLNNTIGNGSVNPECYTDEQLIRFAEIQLEWHNSDIEENLL